MSKGKFNPEDRVYFVEVTLDGRAIKKRFAVKLGQERPVSLVIKHAPVELSITIYDQPVGGEVVSNTVTHHIANPNSLVQFMV